MLPVSDLYRRALAAPHRRETLVQVWHGPELVADSDTGAVTILGGQVSATLGSRVSRTLSLLVDNSLFPTSPDDVLSPFVAVLRVFSGIGYPDGSREIFPVFTGRVRDVAEQPNGTVEVGASDLAQDVIGWQFETPMPSRPGVPITDEIVRLITGALPGAEFAPFDVEDTFTPVLVWDQDRGQALDDLAEAVAGRWYPLGDGRFVVRRYPYTAGVPVVTITDGEGGTAQSAARTVTRSSVYNSVTISSERADGTDPVRVTVRDNVTSSPTRYRGPFGVQTQIIKVQTPLNSSGATRAATQILAASSALGEQWTVSCTPDASLEPGDVAAFRWRGNSAVQVIDSITLPLMTAGAMQLQARSSVPVPIIGQAA